ncbi:putative membrane-bound dehydrogenase domain-containing protein [Fodinibius roseus]|uniref:Putative membrane-bound dehydrogenase domain-containing protein n=1 Tax=Fodinibius roseus TaxID=1194090 RepID=A0A1M5D788_9BACT|nr:PVC-type heme-binding CxxCH protein [Fodinibius roseus]SHF62893.1 putative membrane-bound dehydrogenase domain-containing protein [Fodinibius roseus]
MKIITGWVALVYLALSAVGCDTTEKQKPDNHPRKIEVLFLGHDSDHHNSAAYAPILASALAGNGINFTYSENPEDLNQENLERYDALLLYANHDSISASQEQALLEFVANGKGFLPVHSASYCFRNSGDFVDLVGAQFEDHGTGTFTAEIVNRDHPVTEDLEEFKTWDETYVHTRHNDENRTVLMEREGEDHTEPWTWVRTHGEGRVFYTAYGHDERTWTKPGFQELIKNGIVWSVSDRVRENWKSFASTIPKLQYEERDNIPNYEERDPPPRFQLPLSPEESQKHIQVPVGFKLELFAAEPDIVNPVDMAWDEKGRLWVIETVDYPNTVRNETGVGDDKIKILEDTDKDGRADKVTVFADSLNIPTGLTFVNDGVLVAQAPHFLFLKDTDGDDQADSRKEILSGWGTYDTHAGPSNLQYGFDNQIWGSVGYSGYEGVMGGDSVKFPQGFYKFTTDFDDIDFEYLTTTSNNTWGLGFNETFDVFGSTANNTHVVYMGIPKRYYEDYDGPVGTGRQQWGAGQKKIDGHYGMHPITRNYRQVDVFGGFTAASGFRFYTARQFPEEYWNRIAFVSEPTGGLTHRAIIEENGAGFTEKDGWNIFAAHDEWVSPVQAKVGPDGSLWIADWYNFIVQHNPTPTEERGGYDAETGEGNAHVNPNRDRKHGRIYRLTYKGAESGESMSLSKDDPDALVDALNHDNMFWRLTAQRLLVERGETDVLPELYGLVENTETDELGLNSAALHALWTIHGLDALDGSNEEALETALGALEHPAAGVRKAAIQVLPQTGEARQAIMESGVLEDPNGRTQLAAILATVEMDPSEQVGQALFALSRDSNVVQDEWLAEALKLAGNKHAAGYRTAASTSSAGGQTASDQSSESNAKTIRIKAVVNKLQFDVSEFSVQAGEKVEIVFENPDFMQHNLLITEPGALEKVGEAADDMAGETDAAEKDYVPDISEVLFATSLVNPNNTVTLTFTAPDQPGEYPYVCTFPGHWRTMQGTMIVKE